MKKIVLLIAFLVFFISYQGFASPSQDKELPKKIEKLEEENKELRGEINTIKTDINSMKSDVRSINDSIARIESQNNKQQEQNTIAPKAEQENPENTGNIVNPAPSNNTVTNSRTVIGTGSLTPEKVIAYARRKNPALKQSDELVIRKYFEEASAEGVNVDLAIAQMLYWTVNMTKRVSTNNFGGLSKIGNFNGSFNDVTTGVRAHIQHLKAYAKETPKQKPIVDPRYYIALERGSKGITFDQAYRIWSEKSIYGEKVETILRNLRS